MNNATVVAEVGCAHLGQMDRAKELIKLACLCGADYAKFQKRNPDESVPEAIKNKPHPNKIFSYGDTYLEHRKALELTLEQHKELKKYCEHIGIGYAASVWDLTSAHEIISLNPSYIKVPSACNTHNDLIKVLLNEYEGDIHISRGMMTNKEQLKWEKDWGNILNGPQAQRFVLYHCTSEYPCPFEHLYLEEIRKLQWLSWTHKVGFSNHGYGIASDIAAYILGASWIERHFIDDRTIRHTDASASLEPDGLRRLCRDLNNVRVAMSEKDKPTEEELRQRTKLRYWK